MTAELPALEPDPDAAPTAAERAAFERLFSEFAPRVKGFFLRRGVDGAAAEELVQEVMLTVWAKARRYDPARAPLSTWVFTIARNKHIDAYRRSRRPEPDPEDPCWQPRVVERGQWPDAQAGAQRRQEVLRGALDTLAEEQREVLVLLYMRGMTMAEAADTVGVPLGTIKSRTRRAIEALRGCIDEDPGAA